MLYYNGAGVDITFMGAGEIDPHGHVNATRLGASCPGAGGFIDITQNASHVVFCSSFTAKGLEIACEHGALHIRREGEVRKFVAGVNQISYNGELARAKGQTMHYVTERAVFELRPEGPVLTEIAPVSILSATSGAYGFSSGDRRGSSGYGQPIVRPAALRSRGTSVPEFIL